MPDRYSRRSFLTGVLACGTLSAAAAYAVPGGRGPEKPAPVKAKPVRLNLVTGGDPTKVRARLIAQWNALHPEATIVEKLVSGTGPGGERSDMLDAVNKGSADILNLDVIYVPEFAARGLISPIALDPEAFLSQTLLPNAVFGRSDMFWAAPFGSNVGMLFARGATAGAGIGLIGALADVGADSRQFAAQLTPASNTTAQEPFVVNALEYALSTDADILDRVTGKPAFDLSRWRKALHPLRDVYVENKLYVSDTEAGSIADFAGRGLKYMRNWPDAYQQLRSAKVPDVAAGRIHAGVLPTGILGGASLAVVATGPHRDVAIEAINFLTDAPAQFDIANAGLVPTRVNSLSNGTQLFADIPDVGTAISNARPRPIHPNYSAFSSKFYGHVGNYLSTGVELSAQFIDDMETTLS